MVPAWWFQRVAVVEAQGLCCLHRGGVAHLSRSPDQAAASTREQTDVSLLCVSDPEPWRCGWGLLGCSHVPAPQLCLLLCAVSPDGGAGPWRRPWAVGLAASPVVVNAGQRLSHSLREAQLLTAGRCADELCGRAAGWRAPLSFAPCSAPRGVCGVAAGGGRGCPVGALCQGDARGCT